MERLLEKSSRLVERVSLDKTRFLFQKIDWNNRLIGIKGARGTGKTTMLLQRLKILNLPANRATFWSLDDLFFTRNELLDTAEVFIQHGGTHLFLDEVHKYENWSLHLKNLYDHYPELKIVFTGSSLLEISRQEGDLSRRMLMHELPGLSYREYLFFKGIYEFEPLSLADLLDMGSNLRSVFPRDFKPLAHFKEYLAYGYYPFSFEDIQGYHTRLQQLIRLLVEYDMAEIKGYDIRNAKKMLLLLSIVAAQVPFKPNISAIAQKSGIHRNSVLNYLYYLQEAHLIHMLYPGGTSVARLQKPEKLYLNNTNLAHVFAEGKPNVGNLRETFFLSQLKVLHHVTYPKQGDFLVDNQYTFEIGGRHKDNYQIKDIANAFLVIDDAEYPVNKLPLWVFGFLY